MPLEEREDKGIDLRVPVCNEPERRMSEGNVEKQWDERGICKTFSIQNMKRK
jgi:hypothetical protein